MNQREDPVPSSNLISTQLLVDLVTNTLDPGYAAAAARRGSGNKPGQRWYDRPALALGCLLIGFTVVVGYVHTHRSAPAATKVHDSLVTRVHEAEAQADQLDRQLQQLDTQVNTARAAALPASGGQANVLSRDELQAGQVAVQGPGLQVTLAEPPTSTTSSAAGRGGTVSLNATNILTDRDVQSVVNELWAAGAEAISVNDIRLTTTSAIRFAGQAILVDYQPIASPYVIRAIGSADDLATAFASSAVASRYQTLVSADGIGFAFSEHKTLDLPAATPASLHYASPGAEPSGAGSSGAPPSGGGGSR